MIEPPPARRSAGMPYLQPRNTPLALMSMVRSQTSSSVRDRVVVLRVHDAGVVEEHVQLAERLARARATMRSQSRGLGDVGVAERRAAAAFLIRADGLVRRLHR